MPCIIQDILQYYTSGLIGVPLQSQQILAIPSANLYRLQISSTYRMMGVNPNITTAAYRLGIVATTDTTGSWSIKLPYGASETHPVNPLPQWSIVFPDGRIISGVVPSTAGPISVDDLLTTYGWAQTNAVYVAPVTPGTLAEGVAAITADTQASIVFATPFVLPPRIQLTASLDTVSLESITANYSNVNTTGFIINMGGLFTGTVCWSAKL